MHSLRRHAVKGWAAPAFGAADAAALDSASPAAFLQSGRQAGTCRPRPRPTIETPNRTARHATNDATAEALEQLAERVAVLTREARADRIDDATQLLDAAQLAHRLGVSRDWVYDHANELGALALGSGPRARLRFDLALALRALQTNRPTPSPDRVARADGAVPTRRRSRTPGADVPLLPVYEPRSRGIRARLARSRWSRR
jgi:hypothetical protein